MSPCLHLLINATPTNTFFEPHNLPKEGAKIRILIGLEPFFYEKKLKKSPIAVATKGDGYFSKVTMWSATCQTRLLWLTKMMVLVPRQ